MCANSHGVKKPRSSECIMINFSRQFSQVLASWRHRPRVAGGQTLD